MFKPISGDHWLANKTTGEKKKHTLYECIVKNCKHPQVYEQSGRNNAKRNHIRGVHGIKDKDWAHMKPEEVMRTLPCNTHILPA